jgi:large subunit ribosomal protein L5
VSRLKDYYRREAIPSLLRDLGFTNPMQAPRLVKVAINIGLGEAIQNIKLLDSAVEELKALSGQKPVTTRAKRAIANFKLREGMAIGCMVTLRGEKMYEFFDRLVNVALPQVRDFKGFSDRGFDGRGNYSLGVRDQTIFPEISVEKVDKITGMTVSIVTSARNDQEGKSLLRLLGMPFAS